MLPNIDIIIIAVRNIPSNVCSHTGRVPSSGGSVVLISGGTRSMCEVFSEYVELAVYSNPPDPPGGLCGDSESLASSAIVADVIRRLRDLACLPLSCLNRAGIEKIASRSCFDESLKVKGFRAKSKPYRYERM